MNLKLNLADRWFYVGKTGSGKSTLMKHHLSFYERAHARIAIIDGPDHGWLQAPMVAGKKPGTMLEPVIVRRFDPQLSVQLFQPATPGWADEELHDFVADIFEAGNSVVVFDELFGILDNMHMPPIIMQLWSQGRKHNISVHAASQRPRRIPEIVMSQAEHWCVFKLRNIADRQSVAQWIDYPALIDDNIALRYWYYYDEESEAVTLMKPIKV